mgnify:FL=1
MAVSFSLSSVKEGTLALAHSAAYILCDLSDYVASLCVVIVLCVEDACESNE